MSEMKKCSQCEAELPDDAVFCPECGTRQAAQPPAETADSGVQSGASVLAGAAALAASNAASFDPFANKPSPTSSATTPPAVPSPTAASTAAAQSFQYAMPTPPPEVPQQPVYPQPMHPQAGQASWTQQQTPPSQPGWQQPPAGIMPAPGMQPPANAGGFGKKKVKPEPVAPAAAPMMEKVPAKPPVATLIILGLTIIGLLVWFLMYNSPKLPVFAFSAATANGVVFSFLLMTILAIVGAALFRFNMRGRKLAVFGDILLVIVLLVLFYGLSVTMFKETNLFYRMFIAITGG